MKKRAKTLFALLAVVLLCCAVIGGTAAYLTRAHELQNAFTVGTVMPEVLETFDGTTKTNVAVQNSGDVPIYIRCRVTIYQERPDGSVSNHIPAVDTDYTISYPATLNEQWLEVNGVYYYKMPLEPGAQTTNLIDQCELKQTGIVVDISTQAIQATPAKAVHDAWKVVEAKGDGGLIQTADPVEP